MKTGRAVAIDDTRSDPRVVPELMDAWRIKSVVCAPLSVNGRPIGVAYYNYHATTHRFSAHETDFVARLASSLSAALENAAPTNSSATSPRRCRRTSCTPCPRSPASSSAWLRRPATSPSSWAAISATCSPLDDGTCGHRDGRRGRQGRARRRSDRDGARQDAGLRHDRAVARLRPGKDQRAAAAARPRPAPRDRLSGAARSAHGTADLRQRRPPGAGPPWRHAGRPLEVTYGPPLGTFAAPTQAPRPGSRPTTTSCSTQTASPKRAATAPCTARSASSRPSPGLRGLSAQELADGLLLDVAAYASRLTDDIQIVALRLD